MNKNVLFVDDDANLLQGIRRSLRQSFRVHTALSGDEGLKVIEEEGPFPVIVSDMRMPGMNGAQFLAKARGMAPETVRVLLTGQADFQDAIAAVNDGHIYRFLTKPAPAEMLENVLNDAIRQYELITAEKTLLEQTLKGSIKMIVDILSIVNPDAFNRAIRIRNMVNKIARRMKASKDWRMDVSAMMSQIAFLAVPKDLLDKKLAGTPLLNNDRLLLNKQHKTALELLGNIPRLEEISDILLYAEQPFAREKSNMPLQGKEMPLIARILKVADDFDSQLASGKNEKQAFQAMQFQSYWYDPDVLSALKAVVLNNDVEKRAHVVTIDEIQEGMVLAQDVYTNKGSLLIPENQEITPIQKMRLRNFYEAGFITGKIKIIVEAKAEDLQYS